MRIKRITSAFVLAGCASFAASAALTIGAPSCVQWTFELQQRQKSSFPELDMRAAHVLWLTGALTGMNLVWDTYRKPSDPLRQVQHLGGSEYAAEWVDRFCRANPFSNASDAAAALFQHLIQRAERGERQ